MVQASLSALARSRLLLAAAVGLAIAVIVPAAVMAVLSGLTHHWDGSRLAPLFGLARGYPLYPPPDQGPINGFMYGPMAAFAYVPCLLAHTPTAAIIGGSLLAFGYYLAPAWALTWGPLRQRSAAATPWLARAALGCAFLLLTLMTPGLNYVAFRAHADAPALGLGALGLAVLAGGNGRWRWAPLFSGALLAGAVASKQTFLPLLVVGLGTAFLYRGGRRAAVAFLLGAGLTTALLAGVLAASGGAPGVREIYFNAVEVPRSHNWGMREPGPAALLTRVLLVVRNLFGDNWFVISVAVAAALLRGTTRPADAPAPGDDAPPPSPRRVFAGTPDPSLLLFVGALACLPTTVLGLIKAGGNTNNQAPFVYLLALSALCASHRLLTPAVSPGATPAGTPMAPRLAPAGQAALVGLLVALSLANLPPVGYLRWLLAAGRAVPTPVSFDRQSGIPGLRYFNEPGLNSNQLAFRYAQRHPGNAYFPYNPLAALMAEGQYTHFEMGLLDREVAGRAPTPSHLAAGIPAGAVYLAVPPGEDAEHLRQVFPAFGERVELPELPGWQAFRRRADPAVIPAQP